MIDWTYSDTENWLKQEGFSETVITKLCYDNGLDGKCLLALNEADFGLEPIAQFDLRSRKLLLIAVKKLQRENQSALVELGLLDLPNVHLYPAHSNYTHKDISEYCDSERSPPDSEDGRVHKLQPEIFKAFLSFCYVVVVTWITAFVMVIVHDRVPDMKKYPPLPDIFLDNVPHIPWAFDMCEVTGTFLFSIWLLVLLFHKHR